MLHPVVFLPIVAVGIDVFGAVCPAIVGRDRTEAG
jgi:queuine/archaeosine tRNA-ribosyltransferase